MNAFMDAFSFGTGIISGCNTWRDFVQWAYPSNSEESKQLPEALWKLQTTLPLMQAMIDRAEWSFHKEGVPKLLQELKGVSYDTEDLIEEFEYLKLKSQIKDGAESLDFSKNDILCSFNKVKILQQRADYLMGQMNALVPQNSTPHFDRSVRPETSSIPDSKIFGRHKEVKAVKGLLGVPLGVHSGLKRNRGQTLTAVSSEHKACLSDSENKIVPVMAIVGIGGVGKTTLAQQIFSDQHVKAHFDQELWICVSDEFDTKRLTTELLLSSGERMPSDNLDYLQTKLAKVVQSKRFLLVLDDIWDDALQGNGKEWQRFCAPLMSGLEGSMILVTTRSSQVAKAV
uniref:Uncharacterized protein n=1 Tax=Avena sativa TaxID=4498 RepID=A0ACD5Z9Z2_AVESA